MKKEIQDKWVAALRSGEFTQTQDYLKVEDSYCCLGVLCKLYLDEHPDENEDELLDGNFLPKVVGLWVDENFVSDAKSWTGKFINGFSEGNLIQANDVLGWDFNQIADMIESGKGMLEGGK